MIFASFYSLVEKFSDRFYSQLPILMDWKRDSYDSIFVIVNSLIKMVYYKLIKAIINNLGLTEIIINIIIRHYNLPGLIVTK